MDKFGFRSINFKNANILLFLQYLKLFYLTLAKKCGFRIHHTPFRWPIWIRKNLLIRILRKWKKLCKFLHFACETSFAYDMSWLFIDEKFNICKYVRCAMYKVQQTIHDIRYMPSTWMYLSTLYFSIFQQQLHSFRSGSFLFEPKKANRIVTIWWVLD